MSPRARGHVRGRLDSHGEGWAVLTLFGVSDPELRALHDALCSFASCYAFSATPTLRATVRVWWNPPGSLGELTERLARALGREPRWA